MHTHTHTAALDGADWVVQGQMDVAVDNGTQLWGACTEAELGGDEEGGGVEAEASWSDLLQPKYRICP